MNDIIGSATGKTSRNFRKHGVNALRALAIACSALVLVAPAAQAQGRGGWGHGGGGYHGGYHGGGWGGRGLLWGGVGLGIGLGLGSYYASPYYYDPGYVVVDQPPVVYASPQPVAVAPVAAPVPAYSSSPEPVIYPRNGQSAAKTEADHDQCSQWAGSQRNATSDTSVFNRAVAACLDARGYTVR